MKKPKQAQTTESLKNLLEAMIKDYITGVKLEYSEYIRLVTITPHREPDIFFAVFRISSYASSLRAFYRRLERLIDQDMDLYGVHMVSTTDIAPKYDEAGCRIEEGEQEYLVTACIGFG